jgi:rod shape-determining protein MreD
MPTAVSDVLFSLLWIIVQTALIHLLAVGTIVPDLPLLWIVYLSVRRGQIWGSTAGFFVGLVLDLVGGTTMMLGLSALAKTVGGFLAGYFYNENKTLQTLGGYQWLLIVGICSLVHNLIYFVLFLQGADITWLEGILRYGLPTTVYTLLAALLPMFGFARKVFT